MAQLSLFSADLSEPRVTDIGGLLAAHGQATRSAAGTRISIYLRHEWRVEALVRALLIRDIAADAIAVSAADEHREQGAFLLRTERHTELDHVAAEWTRGAVKSTPQNLTLGAGVLRMWVLAAGETTPLGFTLGLDPHAPGTYEPLAAGCSRAGIAAAIIGASSSRPVLRVVGYRRLMRLAELLGTPPPGAPSHAFPRPTR